MRQTPILILLVLAVAATSTLCRAEDERGEVRTMSHGDLTLSSKSFAPGARIPRVYAYPPEGDNISPQLAWSGLPEGTRELVLIVDDPDAPRAEPWVHWLLYAIPASVHEIPRGASGDEPRLSEPRGAVQGRNDFQDLGWGGPLPPKGHGTHHYHFKLYALDEALGLGPGAVKSELLNAMDGHVLAEAELVGTYSRGPEQP